MRIIAGARQSGKTLWLIQEAARTGAVIVTMTYKEAERITGLASDMGLKIEKIITFEQLRGPALKGRRVKGLLIDNADWLLQHFTNIPIEAVTIGPVEWVKDAKHE